LRGNANCGCFGCAVEVVVMVVVEVVVEEQPPNLMVMISQKPNLK